MKYFLRNEDNLTIFDVGANDGRSIRRLRKHLKLPRIYAFEPGSAVYTELERQAAKYSNVETFPFGLGSGSETRTLYLGRGSVCNSLDPTWSECHRRL